MNSSFPATDDGYLGGSKESTPTNQLEDRVRMSSTSTGTGSRSSSRAKSKSRSRSRSKSNERFLQTVAGSSGAETPTNIDDEDRGEIAFQMATGLLRDTQHIARALAAF